MKWAGDDVELILGNANRRFSGVTSTMLQVLAVQKHQCRLAVLGEHNLPSDVPVIGFWRLAWLCRRPLPDGRHRVFHARRNLEMIQACLLRDLFRGRLRIVFTSTAQRRKSWLTRWLMRRMDGLLSTCQAAAAYMPTPPDRLIPHGIDASLYRPAAAPEVDLPRPRALGIFGRVRAQKGVDLLVRAAREVLPDFPDWCLVVVGEITPDQQAFADDLRQQLDASGLSDRAVFTGTLPFEKVPAYFRSMSIVTALSRNEGFGLTVLEALGSGVPVIATEAGAWPDILGTGEGGELIPVDDLERLVGSLKRLMSDTGLRARLGRQGREHVLAHYTVEREAEALLDYYRELAG